MSAMELIVGIFATIVGGAILLLVGRLISHLNNASAIEERLKNVEKVCDQVKSDMKDHRLEAQAAIKDVAIDLKAMNGDLSKKFDSMQTTQAEILAGLINAGILERRTEHSVKKGR